MKKWYDEEFEDSGWGLVSGIKQVKRSTRL